MLASIPQCRFNGSSVIAEILTELAAQEEACALRRIQIESERQIEDAEVEQSRKGEDKFSARLPSVGVIFAINNSARPL